MLLLILLILLLVLLLIVSLTVAGGATHFLFQFFINKCSFLCTRVAHCHQWLLCLASVSWRRSCACLFLFSQLRLLLAVWLRLVWIVVPVPLHVVILLVPVAILSRLLNFQWRGWRRLSTCSKYLLILLRYKLNWCWTRRMLGHHIMWSIIILCPPNLLLQGLFFICLINCAIIIVLNIIGSTGLGFSLYFTWLDFLEIWTGFPQLGLQRQVVLLRL